MDEGVETFTKRLFAPLFFFCFGLIHFKETGFEAGRATFMEAKLAMVVVAGKEL